MRNFDMTKAMVLVRRDQNGPADDYDAAISDATGWMDLSGAFKGVVTLNPTRNTRRLEPTRNKRRGRVLAGNGAGTFNARAERIDAAAGDEAAEFFDAVERDGEARFSYCIQPNRDLLLTGPGDTLVPAASAQNPQYLGHAVLSNLDQWGRGGEDQAFMQVNAELDDDYEVYRA